MSRSKFLVSAFPPMKDGLGGYAPHIADGILDALKSPGAGGDWRAAAFAGDDFQIFFGK